MRDAAAALREALCDAAPRVLAVLTRRSGDFAAAEDALQEALVAAHQDWAREGVPANPGGWLYRVAGRRLADAADAEAARRRREQVVAREKPAFEAPGEQDDALDALGGDETLALLFLCCHPALTPPSAVALSLRAVAGLTTAEIAAAFLVPTATMAQRISRAKRTLRDAGAVLEMPGPAERAGRLPLVLHMLYLLFSEGYAAAEHPDLVRDELSGEALRLARLVAGLAPDDPEAAGLLALMLLIDARRPARRSPEGDLVPLDEQDRRLWNRGAVAEGVALLERSLARGGEGAYRLQAAIAALHDQAPSVEATDWPQILALYGRLQRLSDNPMVALNRVVAGAMVHGAATGLAWLAELDRDPRIRGHHRLAAVRAHLHALAGDATLAEQHFRVAAAGAASPTERHYLLKKAEAARRDSAPNA